MADESRVKLRAGFEEDFAIFKMDLVVSYSATAPEANDESQPANENSSIINMIRVRTSLLIGVAGVVVGFLALVQ